MIRLKMSKVDHVSWNSIIANNCRSDRLAVAAVLLLNPEKLPIRRIAITMIRMLRLVHQRHQQLLNQADRLAQLRRHVQATLPPIIWLQIQTANALALLNPFYRLMNRSYYVVFYT